MTHPDAQQRPDAGADPPKIIVDSDWKAQAQAEKERLANQRAQDQQSPGPSGAAGIGVGPQGGDQAPPTPFIGLIASLATQALLYLGGIADPETGRAVVAPDHAKHYIDMLAVLQDKTRGNLAKEEQDELEGVLHELRMRFVQIVGRLDELAAHQEAQGSESQASGAPSPQPRE